jgi:modulator of FtsH protease HflC
MRNLRFAIVALIVALVILSLSFFIVDQRQKALVLQFGEIVQMVDKPGWYWKIPLVQNVRYFDSRIQTLDAREPERFITSEKTNVLVDSFVKWRIVDAKQYYLAVGGSEKLAETRLAQRIYNDLRDEFGKRTVHDVVSGERNVIMEIMRQRADEDARQIGVTVLDVRIKRVELPDEVRESVYRRMEAERKRVANERRSTGGAESERIRADADRQREVILAEAYRDAQRIKGEGDAKSSATYAEAFSQDAQFYSFYRSLDAYRASLRGKNDVFVLDPNSEFFRFLKSPGQAK